VHLETISLAIDHRAGKDYLDVWVALYLDGKPDSRSIVEAYRVVGSQSYLTRIVTLRSPNHPVLQQGRRYWILLPASAPNSETALLSAPLDFVPRPALLPSEKTAASGTLPSLPVAQALPFG
jgi:hypothetical protein